MIDEDKDVEEKGTFDLSDSIHFETKKKSDGGKNVSLDWHVHKYKPASIRQTSRVINHWCEAGLVRGERDGEMGWRKFNLYEVIWLRILGELREFGMPIETLKVTKDFLIYGPFMEYMEICSAMLSVLAHGREVEVIVYTNGKASFFSREGKAKKECEGTMKRPYIAISLNDILKEVFGAKYNEALSEPRLMAVRKNDEAMFEAILSGGYKEVNIVYKNNKIDRYETVTVEENDAKVIDILNDLKFGEIKVSKQQGKITEIRRTTKKK